MKKALYLLFGALAIFGIYSCGKTANPNARIQVSLTDDPADYDAVYIDVQDIKINLTGDDVHGWESLPNVHKGIYNLLDLVNDKDTILAEAEIPSGRIHQIRLVLGNNNTLILNGETIPLETPSAQQSGLKLNIQHDVTGGILYKILLDFDAANSINETGNHKYILKPVIRAVLEAVGGSIKGSVQPSSFTSAVLAIQGTDTVGTYTGTDGGFLFKGLAAGSYNLYYLPSDPTYKKDSTMGVIVETGKVTLVDPVVLKQ